MKKTKFMIIIGGFQGRNIFFDVKSRKLYSNKVNERIFPNLRWLVISFGILGNAFLIQVNNIKFESPILRVIVLCATLILISLVCQFGFKDEYLGQNVEAFNPKLYEHVGWKNFLEEERKRVNILLVTFVVSALLAAFQIREYLNDPTMINLVKVFIFYFIFYMAIAKSNFMKRMAAIKQLIKNK
ncbi:ABC transporter permease [uncultured Streptococcus sp.]|uniref:ABC transporter permease n=1 Tax=uncultured Streptococcus sp. TaxID=83427 RepID=UPI0028EB50AE|nr:ABC transporter permease [uncultured Streptococcus sp.]